MVRDIAPAPLLVLVLTHSPSFPLPDLVSAAVDPSSLDIQREIAEGWAELVQTRGSELKAEVHILGSVQEAVETVRGLKAGAGAEEVEVLVTGSLLLIGGLMEVAKFPMEI